MRYIESNGGPLVLLSRQTLSRWGGAVRLDYFKSFRLCESDYNYLCFQAEPIGGFFAGRIATTEGDILVIHYPIPTSIVSSSSNHIYIVQVDAAEPGWDPSSLTGADFEKVKNWGDPFEVTFRDGEFVLFDAAYVESDFRDDTLSAEIAVGTYRCEYARQEWEERADMNFIRIVRKEH